jgi:hypothetical protein
MKFRKAKQIPFVLLVLSAVLFGEALELEVAGNCGCRNK